MRSRTLVAATSVAGAVVASALSMPAASASPSGELFNLASAKHGRAGCGSYVENAALGSTALDIAKTMLNPPGGIAGNGRVPADVMLADRGVSVSGLGEADYINAGGSPQSAMDFWMSGPLSGIFANCGMNDMGAGVWIQNGTFAAVLLAANVTGH